MMQWSAEFDDHWSWSFVASHDMQPTAAYGAASPSA